MKQFLFLLLLLIPALIPAFTINGRVVDENGKPIEYLVVSDSKGVVITDKIGGFDLSSDDPELEIRFHKIGYKDRVLPFNDIAGEKKTVSLLGNKTRHTLILMDGIPLNAAGQEFDLSSIPAEIIDKVEIIKNNAGAYGGAGAIGGIVNVITKKKVGKLNPKDKFKVRNSIDLGSFGFNSEKIAVEFLSKKYQITGTFSRMFARNDYEFENSFAFNEEDKIQKRKNNRKSLSVEQVGKMTS